MDSVEREALAVQIEEVANAMTDQATKIGLPDPFPRLQGMISGLKMAACIVRDNHPKEEDGQ